MRHNLLKKPLFKRLKLLSFERYVSSKWLEDIPGPKSRPFVGNLFQIKDYGGEFDYTSFRKFQQQIHEKYGDIVKWGLFKNKNVLLGNCDHFKEVYRVEGSSPYRSVLTPVAKLCEKLSVPKLLINRNGEDWRKLRTAANPIIARPQVVQSYLPNHNSVANDFIQIIDAKLHDQIDSVRIEKIENLLYLLALEFISEIAFDKRIQCLDEKRRDSSVSDLVRAIDEFFIHIGKLTFSFSIWKLVPTNDWKVFEKAGTFIFKEIYRYIKEAYEQMEKNQANTSKNTVLGQFFSKTARHNLTFDEIVSLMADFFFAGIDTTATAIYYILYELGRNEEAQEELFQEINIIVQKEKIITVEHLEKFKYLKYVVKETLRLHNIVSSHSRKQAEDLTLANYSLPKGTKCVMSTSYVSLSERYFKNPNKFEPSRWRREEAGEEVIHPYAFLPFGYGIRNCIGRRLAEQEIYVTIVKILQKYSISYNGPTPGVKLSLIATPDISLNLNFKKRI